ncbi:hypothetical protein ACLMJK_007989 [Lecanora helva]
MAPSSNVLTPSFGNGIIEDNRTDGYWVEPIKLSQDDPVPSVVASGLVSGVVEILENPIAAAAYRPKYGSCRAEDKPNPVGSWQKYEISVFNSPVALATVDITGNGRQDVIVCHQYGPFMLECDTQGGWITWLENPGRDCLKAGHWKQRTIGRWPAMHRIKAGFFTQKSILEVIGASVVRGPHDKVTPIPIIRFQKPEKVLEATEWPRDIIDDENFSVIHEVTVRKFDGLNGLDSMFISSREGLARLYYKDQKWHRDLITIGEPKEPRQDPYVESPGSGDHWGTGCADGGKVGSDPFAYIATLDPFHGVAACVYTKVDQGLNGTKWKRHILDVYGTPNQRLKTGDGPGHFIVCADFDGDGDDEFLLSLFGPLDRDETGESIKPQPGPHAYKGIMYYKAIDVEKGIFAKWKIADESSARIAVGDFTGHGLLDLISVRYNVKRYYEEPDPKIHIHPNLFAPIQAQSAAPITSTLWDKEALIYLSEPTTDPTDAKRTKKFRSPAAIDLIEVANYKISLEILPFDKEIEIEESEGFKVLYGRVEADGSTRSPYSVNPFTRSSTKVSKSTIKAGPIGAIIFRFTPIEHKSRITEINEDDFVSVGNINLDDGGDHRHVPPPNTWIAAKDVPVKVLVETVGASLPNFKFVKVEDLYWGGAFKGVDFYNLSGFHFRFLDSKQHIAHLQFWTAGTNVNCGVHNHADDIFQEIHVALSPGTTTGGMARLKASHTPQKGEELNKLPESDFDHLVLSRLDEHGGMWERDSYGKSVRRVDSSVVYPWHKWQAGNGSSIDVWAAIEYNPDLDL